MTKTIRNIETYAMPLQVRIGDQEPAEANPLSFNNSIGPGGTAGPFTFDTFLFHRVASNPASPGVWSAWTQEINDIDPVVDVP
jgi:hypothetical protein